MQHSLHTNAISACNVSALLAITGWLSIFLLMLIVPGQSAFAHTELLPCANFGSQYPWNIHLLATTWFNIYCSVIPLFTFLYYVVIDRLCWQDRDINTPRPRANTLHESFLTQGSSVASTQPRRTCRTCQPRSDIFTTVLQVYLYFTCSVSIEGPLITAFERIVKHHSVFKKFAIEGI